MVTMGEWPYMSTVRHLLKTHSVIFLYFLLQIDHDVTSVFYGYSTAATKASHAIFAFVFAIWAHKISGIRYALREII